MDRCIRIAYAGSCVETLAHFPVPAIHGRRGLAALARVPGGTPHRGAGLAALLDPYSALAFGRRELSVHEWLSRWMAEQRQPLRRSRLGIGKRLLPGEKTGIRNRL